MERGLGAVIAIISGILSLALVAVLVSQKAQTGSVLQAAGTALSGIIAAAVSPVTGGTGGGFGSFDTTSGFSN